MEAFRSNRGNTARRVDLLPPDRPQRSAQTSSASRATDIIDAEFEIVPATSAAMSIRSSTTIADASHGGNKRAALPVGQALHRLCHGR